MAFGTGQGPVAEREIGVLSLATKQLGNELDGLTDMAAAFESFANRLVEPRPTPPSPGETTKRSDNAIMSNPTLEIQLQLLGRRLESLNENMRRTLHRLNASI